MPDLEHARMMVALARRDAAALAHLEHGDVAEEIFGFVAQQAVEKALKAWLTALGRDYPRTHELELLLALLEEEGAAIGPFEPLARLAIYAVQLRYSFLDPLEPALDRGWARGSIEELCRHVGSIVESLGE